MTNLYKSIPFSEQEVKRSCVVSAAFDPSWHVPVSMRNKLARLNEQLLLKTLTTEHRRDGFFIGIHHKWWQEQFGTSAYRAVQDAAESMGMLEVNRNADGNKRYCNDPEFSQAGSFPASYRLTEDYRDGNYFFYQMTRKARLRKCDIRLTNLSEVGEKLARKLPLFTVDPSKALHAWDALTAIFINRGTYWASECEFGRLHTTLTGASKQLRSTLSARNNDKHMDSIRLVELDVKSCQPLLLSVLLLCAVRSADSKRWFELAQSGILYEILLDWVIANATPFVMVVKNRPITIDPTKWGRKQLKKALMYCLFGEHPEVESNPVWLAIEALFPSVACFIREFKKGKYQALAHRLQRMESETVIQGCCRELLIIEPDLLLGTIHDCLVIPDTFEELAQNQLKKHFGKLGLEPSIDRTALAV